MGGFTTVFAFTLRRRLAARGWRVTCAVVCALLLLLPAVIMPCAEYFSSRTAPEPGAPEPLAPCRIYHVGGGEAFAPVLEAFSASGVPGAENVTFIASDSTLSAVSGAESEETALALSVTDSGGGWQLEFVLPESSSLTEAQTRRIADTLQSCAYSVLAPEPCSDPESDSAPAAAPSPEPEPEPLPDSSGDPLEATRGILEAVLPFVGIMAVYFLVLFYGQSAANCVILEKTSKLMDTFLIAVTPTRLVLGKVLAVWLSGVIQVLLFIVSAAAGLAAGTSLTLIINPDSDMLLIQALRLLGAVTGLFAPVPCVLAVLIVFAGFGLYCALAAVGGSLAGKPEDLSSANMLFTLILIVSFFCALYGGMSGAAGFTWLDAVPFTSILVTPGRLLLGAVSPVMGVVSLLLVLAFCGLAVLLAGKVYTAMALYKGEVPKPAQVLKMLRGK